MPVTVCPNTGVAVPECSCGTCLRGLVRDNAPHLLAPEPGAAGSGVGGSLAAVPPQSPGAGRDDQGDPGRLAA